jgi:hypothetical protein
MLPLQLVHSPAGVTGSYNSGTRVLQSVLHLQLELWLYGNDTRTFVVMF